MSLSQFFDSLKLSEVDSETIARLPEELPAGLARCFGLEWSNGSDDKLPSGVALTGDFENRLNDFESWIGRTEIRPFFVLGVFNVDALHRLSTPLFLAAKLNSDQLAQSAEFKLVEFKARTISISSLLVELTRQIESERNALGRSSEARICAMYLNSERAIEDLSALTARLRNYSNKIFPTQTLSEISALLGSLAEIKDKISGVFGAKADLQQIYTDEINELLAVSR